MADSLAMDLTRKGVSTDQLVMTIGYDTSSLGLDFQGSVYVHLDMYGRLVPKHAHGTYNLPHFTSSASEITRAAGHLYDRIINRSLLIRRINICANHVKEAPEVSFEQMNCLQTMKRWNERSAGRSGKGGCRKRSSLSRPATEKMPFSRGQTYRRVQPCRNGMRR